MLKRRSPEGGAQVVLTLHVVWAAVAGGRDSGIKVAGLKGAATTKNEKRKTKNEKRKKALHQVVLCVLRPLRLILCQKESRTI